MANIVHGSDGRWSACDRRGLEAHRQAASAVYEAHLRARADDQRSVCAGRPRPAVRPRSSAWRRPLLGRVLVARAPTSVATWPRRAHVRPGRRVAWAATRPAEGAGLALAELGAEWAATGRRAVDAPLELVPTGRCRDDGRRRAALDEHRFAAVIS